MFLTRRINWFDLGSVGKGEKAPLFKKENDLVEIHAGKE
jgi:hypothetical protein